MKIEKINSCFHCYNRFTENGIPSNYCREIENDLTYDFISSGKIHKECTLEDYKNHDREIKLLIVEIQQEILKNISKPNIGKKGCIKRLEDIINQTNNI